MLYNNSKSESYIYITTLLVLVSTDRKKSKTFDDAALHRLPSQSNPLPVFTVGLHIGWKLFSDLQ